MLVEADEGPRADTSLEKLATLRPAFREGGTVTAGNASTLNDGAACLVLASERARRGARRRAARPGRLHRRRRRRPRLHGHRARCRRSAARSTAPASRLDDIDLIEINEAFAAQVLACVRELGIDEERLNVNGGAIALGHPLGCSGRPADDHARLGAAPPRRLATASPRSASASARAWRRCREPAAGCA